MKLEVELVHFVLVFIADLSYFVSFGMFDFELEVEIEIVDLMVLLVGMFLLRVAILVGIISIEKLHLKVLTTISKIDKIHFLVTVFHHSRQ